MLEEPPKESLVLGSIRHETYDSINKKEEEIVTSITKRTALESLKALYKQNYLQILRKAIANNKKRLEEVNISMLEAYRKSFPFIMEESSIRANNIFNFIKANNVFGEELWQKLTPKIISELRIESDELKSLEVSKSAGGPGANLAQASSALGRETHLMGLFSGATGEQAVEALHGYGVSVPRVQASEPLSDTR